MRRWALFTYTLTPHGLSTAASDAVIVAPEAPVLALDDPALALAGPTIEMATPELIGAAAGHIDGSKDVATGTGNGVWNNKDGVCTIDIKATAVSASAGRTSMLAYSGTAYCPHASMVTFTLKFVASVP